MVGASISALWVPVWWDRWFQDRLAQARSQMEQGASAPAARPRTHLRLVPTPVATDLPTRDRVGAQAG